MSDALLIYPAYDFACLYRRCQAQISDYKKRQYVMSHDVLLWEI